MPNSLDKVRAKIDAVDEQLTKLLEQRLQLVKEASLIKAQTKSKVYSQDREAFLLKDRESLGKLHNLPQGLMKDLIKRILRESYIQDENQLYAKASSSNSPIVIVGGKGAMGRLFCSLFQRSGYEVLVIDLNNQDKIPEYLSKAQAVIVSVPIDVTCKVIESLAPYLKTDTVLCDLTSVKEKIVNCMLEHHKGPVIGFHPMFGPDTKGLIKQVIVQVPGRNASACSFLVEQFEIFGAKMVECSGYEHDHAMSIIQALRHFTTYYYGVFLRTLNPNLSKLVELSSPIYRLELEMVARLFAQDPNLYCEIIMSSEQNKILIENYANQLKEELLIIQQQDKAQFIDHFYKVREFFGELAPKFLKESALLLAKFQDER